MKPGPGRRELWLRLAISLFGLGAMILAIVLGGVRGMASVEMVGFCAAFFGGTAIWAAWRLWRG